MARTKRTLSVRVPESAVKVARSATYTKTKVGQSSWKDSKLLSGHTNVDNKTLSFSYPLKAITTTGGIAFHTTYRANSPYDPDPALGGNSAYGFPVMAARYNKYYVKSARCKLAAAGYNNTKIEPIVLMWVDGKSTVTLTDLNTVMGICKANGGRSFQMGHVLGKAEPIRGISMKTKSIHRGGLGDEDNSALVTTNPVNESYFHICVYPLSTTDLDSGMDCNVAVNIEYDTMFYDPKDEF